MKKLILNQRLLDRPNVDYIKSQIETGNNSRTKRALQQLCKLYREGYRIHAPQLIGIEQSLIGLLYTQCKDEKVRRWTLNALARIGREPTCMQAVVETLQKYSDEPQTTAAAIAAIYRMSKQASHILKKLSFDEQMITLAALQHVDANKLDLSALPLNVETASPDLLRLALIVVGLNRAPVNMLNPRHDNKSMVKVLGSHDDSIVSQYSVWAITENSSLGINDLGINIKSIEQQPSNVRSWIFQLIAMTSSDAQKYIEYLELGMRDPDIEPRIGLSLGLRDTYFDGLELLVLDWFTTEDEIDVSHNLLDHLVRQAHNCNSYEEMAIDVYEREAFESSLRQRMQANAARTPIYSKFKRIDYDGSSDLFRGVSSVTNNFGNININQAVAVSLGGNAENSGSVAMHYNPQTIEAIQTELSKAERELHNIDIDSDVKKESLEKVQAAIKEPSPDRINNAINNLKKVEQLASAAIGTGTKISSIIDSLSKVAGFLS